MRKLLIGAMLAVIASPSFAAELEPTVTPDIFTAPPAFPRPRVYDRPVGYEPAVVPDYFTAPPAFPAVRLYNWTGAYIGLNGGFAWGRPNWTSVPDLSSGSYNLSGGLVGGTVGYNLQTAEPFVWGVEADLAWSSVRGTVPPASCAPNCELQSNWLATARLRFGYAFDTIMPYVTAGAAISRLSANTTGAPFGTDYANNLGWTVGLGVEFVLWGPWTAKAEYLYADLNGFSCNVACGGGPISINANESIFRAGINYRIWQR